MTVKLSIEGVSVSISGTEKEVQDFLKTAEFSLYPVLRTFMGFCRLDKSAPCKIEVLVNGEKTMADWS